MNISVLRTMAIAAAAICVGICAYAQSGFINHVVKSGETLPAIAARYGTTVDKIIELNPDAARIVYVGMNLNVPITAVATPTTREPIGTKINLTQNAVAAPAPAATAAPAYTPAPAAAVAAPAESYPNMYTLTQPAPTAQTTAAAPAPNNAASTTTPEHAEASGIFYLGYLNRTYTPDSDSDDYSTKGFTLGWQDDWTLSKGSDLVGGFGYKLDFGWWSDSKEQGGAKAEVSISTYHMTIPLHLGYKVRFDNGYLMPYAGINGSLLIGATQKYSVTVNGKTESKEYTLTSKEDMGKDGKWAVWQPGWQIGARLHLGGLVLFAEYSTPFSEIAKKLNASAFTLGIGFGY